MPDPRTPPSMPRLMIVGPGEMHAEDLDVLGHQLIAHYGDTWTAYHSDMVSAVGRFVGAEDPPYLIPGSGSLGLDAAMANLFAPGERIVVPNTGYFGDRLLAIARQQRLDPIELPVTIGEPVSAEAVADAVAASGATAVAVCHVDTSVATVNPIGEIAAAAAAHGAITLVDGIASVGGDPCSVDAMDLACLVTSTQKGLEAPPGIAIVALGLRGRERFERRQEPPASWYMDFANWDRFRAEWPHHPHPVTMPVSVMLATLSSINRILDTGLDRVIAEKHRLAGRLREGLAELGLAPVARADAQAGMIVAAYADDPAAIVARVLQDGIQIAGGLAPLAGKAIRIGVIGAAATDEMADQVLASIRKAVSQ